MVKYLINLLDKTNKMFQLVNPLNKRMSITSSVELKAAIDLAILGNKSILPDIGKYIAYNYYMCFHIKEGSPDDLENEVIYKAFEKDYPDLFAQVEGWVTYNFSKFNLNDDE